MSSTLEVGGILEEDNALGNNGMPDQTVNDEENQNSNDSSFDCNDDTYDFSHQQRGLAIIINNEHFHQSLFLRFRIWLLRVLQYWGFCIDFEMHDSTGPLINRTGASHDVEDLELAFKTLEFDVKIYNDLKRKKMVRRLKSDAKTYNHHESDCLALAVLTHGSSVQVDVKGIIEPERHQLDVLYGVDGIYEYLRTFVNIFNDQNCPGLIGKPRLFFLQACRGNKIDEGVVLPNYKHKKVASNYGIKQRLRIPQRHGLYPSDETDIELRLETADPSDPTTDMDMDTDESNTVIRVIPPVGERDFLVMYATPPGYYAMKDKNGGSTFIRNLSRVLIDDVSKSTPLHKALTTVCHDVAFNFQGEIRGRPEEGDETDGKYVKQMPHIEIHLRKCVVMNSKHGP